MSKLDIKAVFRVAIAKDVIKRINESLIIPKQYIYFYTESSKTNEECKACALGGLFASLYFGLEKDKTDFKPEKYDEDHQFSEIFETLSKYFDPIQLYEIEAAFEEWNVDNLVYEHRTELLNLGVLDYDVNGYTSSFPDFSSTKMYGSTNKMLAIMNNIIKNNGFFDGKEFLK
jgi:hypothetical protein